MAATATLFPLRSWIESEADEYQNGRKKLVTFMDPENDNSTQKNNTIKREYKESIICRTTIAYGIAELLKRSSNEELDKDNIIEIDNFTVSISNQRGSSQRSWDDIKGVGMVSSGLSLMMEEPSYLSGLLEEGDDDFDGQMGRCLEVEITSAEPKKEKLKNAKTEAEVATVCRSEQNNNRCHLFARLLYELFACEPFPDYTLTVDDTTLAKEPPQKRAKSQDVSSRKNLMLARAKGDFDRAEQQFQIPCIIRMQKLGIPTSICRMTQNLLESAFKGDGGQWHDAYESLGAVGEDLHLLLLDPGRFVFDNENHTVENGVQLLYRKDKLYGRDKEATLITDAFCRVSRGESEAFFIGGFSGSGKSMLVNSLRRRVNHVGGYTIKYKFDAISQERPLSGVISAFNQICLMIKCRARPVIAKKLKEEFGVDFSLLMRLLPNVRVLFPKHVNQLLNVDAGEKMNARSVSFALLRFVRVVSSSRHPVMLFLDDIQWADSTALDVIHTILSDTMGSYMLFVGAYRDNEVQVDHPIFDLIERLKISNVRATKVSLSGLDQEDVNTMISDALCLCPRACKSLSGIVFQKTKGSPFFVLEFIKSLKSRGLLQYNFHQKRWVWNEDIIRTEDITDNVLHLLSSNMNGLSNNVQTLLKLMACLGSSTHESVIGYLSESVEYSEVSNWLKGALIDGFIQKEGEGVLTFVHDKVREAAYNLIPDKDKKQFHYHLGKALNSSCDGKDVGDTLFLIANQVNHGHECISGDEELNISIAFAKLNMRAGKRALDGCDHKTAYSYLKVALSLLPADHWESHYDLSLRLHFLASSAANSCCHYDEAERMSRSIFERSRCFEDKVPSFLLLSQIFQTQGKCIDAYNTCSSVLLQLGETIPDAVAPGIAKTMVEDTLKMYEEVDDIDWLERNIEDNALRTTLQFYSSIADSSYLCKPVTMAVYFTCKAVQLSLRKGICDHTTMSLLQFTRVMNMATDDNAVMCYRIAKNALSLRERFDTVAQIPEVYLNFYGGIAWRFETFQVSADYLCRGFEIGLSTGNTHAAWLCALQATLFSIISGANLQSMLNKIDYYLHLSKTFNIKIGKNLFLVYRDTVSMLIDKGEATCIEAKPTLGDLTDPGNKLRIVYYRHEAVRAFWLGYTERCEHCCQKAIPFEQDDARLIKFQLEFYYALNSVDKWRGYNSAKCHEVVQNTIRLMRNAAVNSDWNFTNKLRLLEAEKQSLSFNHHEAIASYDASIASAKKSGFIHEQGLACEKAAFYHKRKGSVCIAMGYFEQARQCYEEWGSSVKVNSIQGELNNAQILLNNELARRG